MNKNIIDCFEQLEIKPECFHVLLFGAEPLAEAISTDGLLDP